MLKSLSPAINHSVTVVAPSGRVVQEKTDAGIKQLKSMGFQVRLAEHLYSQDHRFAGTIEQRIHDFQQALNDPTCDAIFCARGGYGVTKIIDHLDFSAFKLNPKWLIGFSDITAIHCHLDNFGIPSIHGPMPNSFGQTHDNHLEELFNMLEGNMARQHFFETTKINRPGIAEGTLIGGNLSILAHLAGTSSFPDFKGKILFLEDLNEELYHADRMLVQLQRAQVFQNIAGIMIGSFSTMKDSSSDPFGMDVFEMVQEKLEYKSIPICTGLPVGHGEDNLPLVVGGKVKLEVSLTEARFKYLF